MGDQQTHGGAGRVVGYPKPATGLSVTELLATTTPSSPRAWPLVVALVVGLFPLAFPVAVWATVSYWRRPRSQWRWRWFSMGMLGLGLLNFVGFLVYGYGRYYTFG